MSAGVYVPLLVDQAVAAAYTGHPASTIRGWALQGRISRYGRGRGKVRYDLYELHSETEDDAGVKHPGATPEMPAERRGRMAIAA